MSLAFVKDYRDEGTLRLSFNDLMQKTYGFNLGAWYSEGYWGSRYIPYSLALGNRIIANISVNLMDFIIDGIEYRAVQLGTVMTDEAYRKRGLSRELMNKVFADYEGKCDFIFLFANNTVLDFYPKFGFTMAPEYRCSVVYSIYDRKEYVRRLDLDHELDKSTLTRLLENAVPSGKISCLRNKSLVMFYCLYFMKNMVYYLPDLDTAVVADITGDTLQILDVFSEKPFDLRRIAAAFATTGTVNTAFAFTPLHTDDTFEFSMKCCEGDTLFIKSYRSFQMPKAMFPVLSHA
jgi:GNAT superfamily N-acetyltransferase